MLSLVKITTSFNADTDGLAGLQQFAGDATLMYYTTDEAKEYMNQGHFAPGSMLPKVEAAVDFAASGKNRTSLITLLEKAIDGSWCICQTL